MAQSRTSILTDNSGQPHALRLTPDSTYAPHCHTEFDHGMCHVIVQCGGTRLDVLRWICGRRSDRRLWRVGGPTGHAYFIRRLQLKYWVKHHRQGDVDQANWL